MRYRYLDSPVGELLVAGSGTSILQLHFPGQSGRIEPELDWQHDPLGFDDARRQLEEYFSGQRTRFSLELMPRGTPFQLSVLRALTEIPYGETRSYRDIAIRLGNPKAVRAVGAANGRNPLPIIIPCHRVIGSDGSLTGFGGGLMTKRFLLDLERGIRPSGVQAMRDLKTSK